MKKELAILVLSCDKYSELWDLFFNRWKKYWPDCNYPLYLLSNISLYQSSGVINLNTGIDVDWSSNLMISLDMIEEENVLLMMDDAPLNAMVDNDEFSYFIKYFLDKKLNYLNMKSSPKPNNNLDQKIGELLPGTLYRTAIVPCLWKKNILKDLLITGETAWSFEIAGSERSNKFQGFNSTINPFFNLMHCVIRGKIDRRVWKELKKNGEEKNLKFPIMSIEEQINFMYRQLVSKLFNMIVPNKYKKNIRKFIKNE